MAGKKVLTQKIAKQFLNDEDSVDLSEFTAIEDAAARALAKHEGSLNLDWDALAEENRSWPDSVKELLKIVAGSPGTELPFFGDKSGLFVKVRCGGCGRREEIPVDLDLGDWIGDTRPSLEGHGWKALTSDDWPTDDVIRCPDCVISDCCPKCGEASLVSILGQKSPACIGCEVEKLKTLLHFNVGCSESTASNEYSEDEDDLDKEESLNDDNGQENEYLDDGPRSEHAGPSGTVTNSIGMKLVPIPAGTFMMGSAKKEQELDDEEAQHQVTLTRDFYLGMTPVTQAQYAKVMGENPSCFQGDEVQGRDSSELPVETLSWKDADEFCKKLSELPEEKAAGRVYQLPTEAEWEYACRAGSTTAYCFGNDEGLLGDYAWFKENSNDRTHPVALKKPNAWGLHDMHGNVWEYCSDRYGEYSKGAVSDPVGPAKGVGRVIRGGCWDNVAADCGSAGRNGFHQKAYNQKCGFRVALSSPGIPK